MKKKKRGLAAGQEERDALRIIQGKKKKKVFHPYYRRKCSGRKTSKESGGSLLGDGRSAGKNRSGKKRRLKGNTLEEVLYEGTRQGRNL